MDVREVLPRDAIPSIDDPSFSSSYIGADDDQVIVVEEAPARAYPIRILHYHEIANDVLSMDAGAEPIAVTWCPLCGSAIVYDRRLGDRTLTFGVSGKLADDDLVMYDRETGSEWKQSLGACIAGELEGARLTVRSASMMTYAEFEAAHPAGLVLQPPHTPSEVASDDDRPAPVNYDLAPYERYFERDGFGLGAHRRGENDRRWTRGDIEPKTVVLGLEIADEAMGFAVPTVRNAGGVVQTSVGGTAVVVFESAGELHAFADPGWPFERTDGAIIGDGSEWDPTTGRAADGRQLDRIAARRLFAFTWQDDHGADAFCEVGPDDT